MRFTINRFIQVAMLACVASLPVLAETQNLHLPPQLQGVGIDQRLNAQVPLDTMFRDETGASVPLRKYFDGKAVIIAPVYYTCPMLCTQILRGLVSGLKPLSLRPGKDFNVVAISFDPSNTPQDAASKREMYARRYWGRKGGNQGFHFLVGSPQSIHAVMSAIGFRYRWDPKAKMFAHASGVMVLTPEGRVSRYFYGVEYEPKDLKLGLMDSSNHHIGSLADEILLFCCKYDPTTGKYTLTVLSVLWWAGVLTLLAMGTGFLLLWRSDIRRTRAIQVRHPLQESSKV
jgi:protein SCO1/2